MKEQDPRMEGAMLSAEKRQKLIGEYDVTLSGDDFIIKLPSGKSLTVPATETTNIVGDEGSKNIPTEDFVASLFNV